MIPQQALSRLSFAAALFAPTVLVLAHEPQPDRSLGMAIWALCCAVVLAALPWRWFRLLIWLSWVGLPATLWWLGYSALNGIGPGWEAAQAAMASNGAEVIEALSIVAGMRGFLALAIAHMIFLAFAALFAFRSVSPENSERSSGVTEVALLAALIPISASSVTSEFVPDAPQIFSATDSLASPVGSYALIARMAIEQVLFGEQLANGDRRPAIESKRITAPILALLVVGESVRAEGLGPARIERGPWTRKLNERFQHGLGAWLPTTCAASNGTHLALPLLLTGLPPSKLDAARTEPSGLARLNAAGFATGWITNQDRIAFQEQGHDFYWSHPRSVSYDEAMLPVLRAFMGPLLMHDVGKERPRAALLHMRGSHFDYVERYPGVVFPPEPDGLSAEKLEELRYERSEEYSASVLLQVAQLLDDAAVPAFAVFSSDHGENLAVDHNGVLHHLGARTSVRDGTTASLVMWNLAMAETGRPAKVLRNILDAGRISYLDVWHIWMAFAGLEDDPPSPQPDPLIWAAPDAKGYRAVHCSELKL